MRILLILAVLAIGGAAEAQTVYVRPHMRSNGTWVQGYYRTSPDPYFYNNWSAWGNVNPYTGRIGYQAYAPQRFSPYAPRYQFDRMRSQYEWDRLYDQGNQPLLRTEPAEW